MFDARANASSSPSVPERPTLLHQAIDGVAVASLIVQRLCRRATLNRVDPADLRDLAHLKRLLKGVGDCLLDLRDGATES